MVQKAWETEMTRLRIGRPVRAALLDQLVAAGLAPTTPEGTTILDIDIGDADGWLTVPEAQVQAARAAIDAHDAAALDAAAAALATQDSGDLAKVRAAYQTLRANADALRADAATLTAMTTAITAAQTKGRLIQLEGALADVSDATASLARYVGRRLG